MKISKVSIYAFSCLIFICGCQVYNRSSVTFFNTEATTEGQVRIKTDDAHSVNADKEQSSSISASAGDGNVSSSSDLRQKQNDKENQETQLKETQNK